MDFQRYSLVMWLIVAIVWILTAFNNKSNIKQEHNVRRYFYLLIAGFAFVIFYSNISSIDLFNKEIIPNSPARQWVGLLLTFFSLSFAIWARINLGKNWSGRVTLKKEHELITYGAYSVTRNPIYTGIIFGLVGDAVRLGKLKGFIAAIIIAIAFLFKIRREEILLTSHFGDAYLNYKKKVKSLIPFIW